MTVTITDAEREVMEVLWRQEPRSTQEIVFEAGQARGWKEGTVKSLLNRLLRKHAVKALRDGRRYLYSPLISRETYLFEESKGVLDRLFGGHVAPLVAHFSERRKLSKKDIAQLRKLLQELDDEQP